MTDPKEPTHAERLAAARRERRLVDYGEACAGWSIAAEIREHVATLVVQLGEVAVATGIDTCRTLVRMAVDEATEQRDLAWQHVLDAHAALPDDVDIDLPQPIDQQDVGSYVARVVPVIGEPAPPDTSTRDGALVADLLRVLAMSATTNAEDPSEPFVVDRDKRAAALTDFVQHFGMVIA